MTSRFATNFIFNPQNQQRYLEVNREGQPLQRQVPLTYQTYSGNGNTTLVYDGSDVVTITSALSAGDLTIDFSAMNNYLGRTVQVISEDELTNDLIFDFGSGSLYVPPNPSPVTSVSYTGTDSPLAAEITFYKINTAMLVGNSIPTISGAPRILNFNWSTDVANDLNDGTAQQISWIIDAPNNTTTLTLGGGTAVGTCQNFTVTKPGPYTITHQEFIVCDPSIAFRNFISIVNESSVWAYNESSLGLTGQRTGGSVTLNLVEDDVIAIYSGNAAGPGTVVNPLDATFGTLSIIQHVY